MLGYPEATTGTASRERETTWCMKKNAEETAIETDDDDDDLRSVLVHF